MQENLHELSFCPMMMQKFFELSGFKNPGNIDIRT